MSRTPLVVYLLTPHYGSDIQFQQPVCAHPCPRLPYGLFHIDSLVQILFQTLEKYDIADPNLIT